MQTEQEFTDCRWRSSSKSATSAAWNQLQRALALKTTHETREAFFRISADQPTRSLFEIVNRFKFLSLSGASTWHLRRGSSGEHLPSPQPTHIDNYVDHQSADMTWPHGRHTHRQFTAVSATAAHLTTRLILHAAMQTPIFALIHPRDLTVSLQQHGLINEYSSCANELYIEVPPGVLTIGIVFVGRLCH